MKTQMNSVNRNDDSENELIPSNNSRAQLDS